MRDFHVQRKGSEECGAFIHCLMSSMPVESGDEVRKSLELQQQQTIDYRDSIHQVVITPQHQA